MVFLKPIALFLDVDGTLLEFAHRPDAVTLNAILPVVLQQLYDRLDGALALISGRRIDEIDDLFAPLRLPAAGQHGMERRDARGLLHRADTVHGLDDIRVSLHRFADNHDGILLEDKGSALALHFRQAPDVEVAAHNLVRTVTSNRDDLHYLAGNMVFEIKPRAVDKGVAIGCFLKEMPFSGRLPVFIGDDVTDEDGFRCVNERGGLSIRVGEASNSVARYGVPDVCSVLEWLCAVAENFDECKP